MWRICSTLWTGQGETQGVGKCDFFVTLKQAERKWQLGFLGAPHRVARR